MTWAELRELAIAGAVLGYLALMAWGLVLWAQQPDLWGEPEPVVEEVVA